jgi:hypothetical protein
MVEGNGLERWILRLSARGISPRSLLTVIAPIEDPEELDSVLQEIHNRLLPRYLTIENPLQMKNCRELRSRWNEIAIPRRLEGPVWGWSVPSARSRWAKAVFMRLDREDRERAAYHMSSGLYPNLWALIPKAQVVQIVREWLQGNVWLEFRPGRDNMNKAILARAFLRVKYMPEIESHSQLGLIDVDSRVIRHGHSTVSWKGSHTEMGMSTTPTGLYNLVRYARYLLQDKNIGFKAKTRLLSQKTTQMMEDIQVLSNGSNVHLSSDSGEQVVVFRLSRGHVIHMNKTHRIVQLGPTTDMYSWRRQDLDGPLITIVSESTLGMKNALWGWAVSVGRGGTLVVPDTHWDAMSELWLKGYILWPQVIESLIPYQWTTGYPFPGWNDIPGRFCFGSAPTSTYPMWGGEKGGGAVHRDNNGNHYAEAFWEQPRIACLMQDGAFSAEAEVSGRMLVYVPEIEMLNRMERAFLTLRGEVWNKRLPIDIEFPLVTQTVRKTIQMMVSYGLKGAYAWKYPVCGPTSKMWWWAADIPVAEGRPKGISPFKSCSSIWDELSRRGFSTPGMLRPSKIGPDKSGGAVGGGAISGGLLGSYVDGWLFGYKPQQIGLTSDGYIIDWDSATENDKDRVPGKSNEKRIVGQIQRVPENTKRMIERSEHALRGRITFPKCGISRCTSSNCNQRTDRLNHENRAAVAIDWREVPNSYLVSPDAASRVSNLYV